MKRITKTVLSLILLIGLVSPFAVMGQAGAQTKAQATNCYDKWNGKQLTATAIDNHLHTDTDTCWKTNGGSCTAANEQAEQQAVHNGNGDKKFKVTCSKDPKAATKNATSGEDASTATGGKSVGFGENCSQSDKAEGGTVCTDPAMKTCSKSDGCDIIDKYINPIINTLSILVGLAVTIGIIWGGVQVAMAAGDPSKVAEGRKHIQNAVIALVMYILLFAFLNWLVPGGLL